VSESKASASKRQASASEREASASEPGRARVIRRQRVKSFFFFEFSICFIYNLSLSFVFFVLMLAIEFWGVCFLIIRNGRVGR
jgi:hypothetical protein